HLGIAAPLESPIYGQTRVVGSPLNFPGVSKEIRSPTPEAGAHTDEVLRWLGYTPTDIEQMRASGAI
ncbi:MAG: CoA transferase, partial [Burkholderiales bacterium]